MGDRNLLLENAGGYISLNNVIYEVCHYVDEVRDEGCWDGPVAYEVIRVINGVPMFFEDHCARLHGSLARLNVEQAPGAEPPVEPNAEQAACPEPPARLNTEQAAFPEPPARLATGQFPGAEALSGSIGALLDACGERDCNVKLWAAPAAAGGINLFININRSFYPPPGYYRDGVGTALYGHTRDDPNTKRHVAGFKEKMLSMIAGDIFEVLLYDGSRRLTEGSRSNLFFSRGGRLYTAPGHMILMGTIRKYVYEAAERAGIEIVERPVTLDELGVNKGTDYGAFITGTSIDVLPVSRIGDIQLNSASDPVINAIRVEFEKIAQAYINKRIS